MTAASLAHRIWEVSHLTGKFRLRSGRVATEYFDKYQFEADPDLLSAVAQGLRPLVPDDAEVLAGLELGGIAIVTALSRETGLPAAFVRKKAKEYGTARLAEGASVEGKRVVVVEDVVTSGGQVIASVGDLRSLGAQVSKAICVVDREEGGREALAREGVELRSLFTKSTLSEVAQASNVQAAHTRSDGPLPEQPR